MGTTQTDRILVLGGRGLLGAALVEAANYSGYKVYSASRNDPTYPLDIRSDDQLAQVVATIEPTIIINTVANVDIASCEKQPAQAWLTNSRPAARIADIARQHSTRVIHISTDHFFYASTTSKHTEQANINLANEYAITKYAAEHLALTWPETTVIRTNIVGVRNYGPPSFAEWCISAIDQNVPVTLYTDQYVSSIDVWSLSDLILQLARKPYNGLINVASKESFTKAEFFVELARQRGRQIPNATFGSAKQLVPRRPNSMALDVTQVERHLNRPMPTLNQVVKAVLTRYNQKRYTK